MKSKPPKSPMVQEAETMLLIAQTLAPIPKSKACEIMSCVCIHFGDYDRAAEFLGLARQWKAREEQ